MALNYMGLSDPHLGSARHIFLLRYFRPFFFSSSPLSSISPTTLMTCTFAAAVPHTRILLDATGVPQAGGRV